MNNFTIPNIQIFTRVILRCDGARCNKPVVVSLFLKTAVQPCERPPVQLVLPPSTRDGDSRPPPPLLSRNVTVVGVFRPAAAEVESGPQPKMWS